MKSRILNKTSLLGDKMISHRRFIHSNAETGFETDITSKYIYETLCSIGVECFILPKNIVVGSIRGKERGKTILLRSDIDALPFKEESGVDFASENGCNHACGHDMHAAMLLGAAEVLHSIKDNISGNVKFLFQPGEEILSGAKKAIECGILDGIDMAMTLHVMTASDFPVGSILLSYDTPCAPSADFFEIRIKGEGCHGSSPAMGIDPITCACRIVTSLEHIKAYEIGIHEKAILTFGEIHSGNSANVIPDEAKLSGSFRCFDEETREFIKKRFEEISYGIAKSFRCGCKIKFTSSCPSLINDSVLLKKTAENMGNLLGEDYVIKIKDTRSKIQGSEDFAYISQAIPSVSVAIPAGSTKDGFCYPLHSPKVTFDENALTVGCNVYAYNAYSLLT